MAAAPSATTHAALGTVRPRHRLLGSLALVIGLKLTVILTLWALYFSPSKRPQTSPETIADELLGPAETPSAATPLPPAP